MQIRKAKDSEEWNAIVDKSPYSVLFHRYELCELKENFLPLIIKERRHSFVFPLTVIKLLKTFKVAFSPIYDYATILPDSGRALNLISEALDKVADFLREVRIDYLSTCAPTFWSKKYAYYIDSWFREHKASVQVMYAHMIRTGNNGFEDIWKNVFRKNAREKVRKAERVGVGIIEIDTEDDMHAWIEDIHQCNLSALERQGREGAYPDSCKEVYLSELISAKRCLGDYFKIYGAVYHQRLVAYMIVQEYNKLMEVTKAMSHTKFLDRCPNDALISYIVKKACERNFYLFEYGLDRVKMNGKIPSLHPRLWTYKSKFGFEEIPLLIYRLGLTRPGMMIQRLYSGREYIITRSSYVPESVRGFFLKFYAPKRRRFSSFMFG